MGSALTSSMTKLNIIGSDQTQQLSQLRVYLHQNKISSKLALRVHRNAQHALVEQQKSLAESSVTLLNFVSEPLHVEIHLEMYSPVLSMHPFFKEYIEMCSQVMRKVCHLATSMLSVCVGDIIFAAGETLEEPNMYIICSGECEYAFDDDSHTLSSGNWLAEPVLWTSWVHRGDFMGKGDCRLCALGANSFQKICSLFEHSGGFDPRDRAQEYCDVLNVEDNPSDMDILIESSLKEDLERGGNPSLFPRSCVRCQMLRFHRRYSTFLPLSPSFPSIGVVLYFPTGVTTACVICHHWLWALPHPLTCNTDSIPELSAWIVQVPHLGPGALWFALRA